MTDPKICPACGEKNHPQLNRCWKCGCVFDAAALERENKKPSKENAFKEILIPGMFFLGLFWIFSLLALPVTAKVEKGSGGNRNWSTVEGKVTKSETRENINSSLAYDAVVEYQYSVDGKSYVGRNRTFQMHPHTKEAVSKIVASYPEGKIVTVYYDPKNPTIECLELGSGFSALWLFSVLVFGVVTVGLIGGGGVLLFYARARKDGDGSNSEQGRKAMVAGMKQCPHCGKVFNFFSFWAVFGLMASLDDPMRRATLYQPAGSCPECKRRLVIKYASPEESRMIARKYALRILGPTLFVLFCVWFFLGGSRWDIKTQMVFWMPTLGGVLGFFLAFVRYKSAEL